MPPPRGRRVLAGVAQVAAVIAAAWLSWTLLHPAIGLIVALAGLFAFVARHDNHTGSLVMVTGLFVGVIAILVVVLVAMAAMASR